MSMHIKCDGNSYDDGRYLGGWIENRLESDGGIERQIGRLQSVIASLLELHITLGIISPEQLFEMLGTGKGHNHRIVKDDPS